MLTISIYKLDYYYFISIKKQLKTVLGFRSEYNTFHDKNRGILYF